MIHIDLQGGLGNQLFRWAVVRALQMDSGEEVTIYDYHRESAPHTRRALELMTPKIDTIHYLDLEPTSPPFFKQIAPIRSFFYLALHKTYRTLFHVSSGDDYQKMYCRLQPLWNLLGFSVLDARYVPIKRYPLFRDFFCFGYYFSSQYFGTHTEQIRQELQHPEIIGEQNDEVFRMMRETNSVAVHIRLGDYVSAQWAGGLFVCDEPYFCDAMAMACKDLNDPTFFIFTNDQERAKQMNFPCKGRVIFCPEGNGPVADLQLMAQCKHFIISNSSYSWWAQFLGNAPDKHVYAPDVWYRDHTPSDLYEDDWTLIHVELPNIDNILVK